MHAPWIELWQETKETGPPSPGAQVRGDYKSMDDSEADSAWKAEPSVSEDLWEPRPCSLPRLPTFHWTGPPLSQQLGTVYTALEKGFVTF